MKKIRAFQKIISLAENDTNGEAEFPTIPGGVVGYSTVVIGAPPAGQSCDVVIKDGGQNISDPLDIALTEGAGRATVQGSIVPLIVPNPGNITAVITPSAAIGNGEDYKVKVVVWYVDGQRGQITSLNECF